MKTEHHHTTGGRERPRTVSLVVIAFVAAGVYLLLVHTGHVLAALPYLVLLACPLMHLFMRHGAHGNDNHAARSRNQEDRRTRDE